MTNNQNIESLRNSTVYGNNGDKIGKVGEIYLDDQTNEPTFATVNTGLFGSKETFVPLNQASAAENGITVPYDKDFVKDAPNIDDDGSLTPEEEERIYEYYRLDGSASDQQNTSENRTDRTGAEDHERSQDGNASAGTAAAGTAAAGTAAGTAAAGNGRHSNGQAEDARAGQAEDVAPRGEPDRPASGADAQNGAAGRHGAAENDVVAHEERLAATDQTERRETDQVRLRKHVKTDTETVEVPVQREEVRVERTKIDPDSPEARQESGTTEFGKDEDVTVTAHEERPVVDTETVATERVSVSKEAHEDTEEVTGQVRKEEIDVDENGERRR